MTEIRKPTAADRMRRAATRGRTDTPAPASASERLDVPAVRVEPVKTTVALSPDLHGRLKIWGTQNGNATISDVVRALVAELIDADSEQGNADLVDAVRRRLRHMRS